MLDSFPAALTVGAIFGFLSGLGIGGGTLLMLWLTLLVGLEAPDARMINLLYFLPAAACACFFRWKQGSLPIKKLLLPILAGCVCAGIASWLGGQLDTGLLKKLFGGLLVVTGLRELFYRDKELR